MTKKLQTAVMGVTGYAGAELARLLLHHPRLQGVPPVFAGRVNEKDAARGGVPLAEIHPQLADSTGNGELLLQPLPANAANPTNPTNQKDAGDSLMCPLIVC